MIRLGLPPRYQSFIQGALQTIDSWFAQVTVRFNLFQRSGVPVLTDVPESQWGLFRDTTTGKVYLSANSAGTLKTQELGAAGGTGNVVGPASSVVNNVVLFNNTTGTLISDSGKTMSAAGVGLGNVTNDAQTKASIVPNTAPGTGGILVGNLAGVAYSPVAMSGDTSITSTGAVTVNKVAGITPAGGIPVFLGTPSSANLATAVTDETGTGLLVFNTGPTISNVRLTTTTFMSVTTPASIAVAATLTAAQLLATLIQYTGAAAALTLPTGTLMDAAITSPTLSTDQGFDFYVINTGSGAATMTAGTGFTIVGSATVTNGTSAHYRARRTAPNTYVAYRVS